jgi:hypothetical protein
MLHGKRSSYEDDHGWWVTRDFQGGSHGLFGDIMRDTEDKHKITWPGHMVVIRAKYCQNKNHVTEKNLSRDCLIISIV